jgi:O-antigen/teichoic acid export membrane protein
VLAVALPSLFRSTDARALLNLAAVVSLFGVAATPILWVTAGRAIPLIYGAPYAGAVPAFRILILSLPLMSLNFALTHQLIGWDGQRAYAAICAVALAVNVAVNAYLVPTLSIEGAAWATVWTEVVVTSGCGLALWFAAPRRTRAALPLAS